MNTKSEVDDADEVAAGVAEIMQRALADALLRRCDGRLRGCKRAALSAAEQEWIQDIVSMVERFSKSPGRGRGARADGRPSGEPATCSPIARALARSRPRASDVPSQEFDLVYVPMACGAQGEDVGELESIRSMREAKRPPGSGNEA